MHPLQALDRCPQRRPEARGRVAQGRKQAGDREVAQEVVLALEAL